MMLYLSQDALRAIRQGTTFHTADACLWCHPHLYGLPNLDCDAFHPHSMSAPHSRTFIGAQVVALVVVTRSQNATMRSWVICGNVPHYSTCYQNRAHYSRDRVTVTLYMSCGWQINAALIAWLSQFFTATHPSAYTLFCPPTWGGAQR